MVNRLFRFASQGSGIALSAMVVAAMSVHGHGSIASAETEVQQNRLTTHVVNHSMAARKETRGRVTKVDYYFWFNPFISHPPY